jgi:hypothetical protein
MDIAPSKCQNSRYIMYLENFLSQNSVTNFTDEPKKQSVFMMPC